MLERVDEAILSLDLAFDHALETFEMLRRGAVLSGRDVPLEDDPSILVRIRRRFGV